MAAADSGEKESSWLIDMVIQFMRSPSWNDPLQAFIDEKCTSFDDFQEENRHEYVEVHNEFKSLVDTLLTVHLLEVDMQPDEFEKQVLDSGLSDDPRLQQVVGRAWIQAAEDFVTFKAMMIESHARMQHQAEQTLKDVAAADAAVANNSAVAAAAPSGAALIAEMAALSVNTAPPAAAAQDASVPARAPAAPSTATTSAALGNPGGNKAAPSASQERVFASGGGSYGRAGMAGGKKSGGSEKADAVRKAISASLRPK